MPPAPVARRVARVVKRQAEQLSAHGRESLQQAVVISQRRRRITKVHVGAVIDRLEPRYQIERIGLSHARTRLAARVAARPPAGPVAESGAAVRHNLVINGAEGEGHVQPARLHSGRRV
eukprot:702782-Prymnesium_polylepis.2